MLDRFSLVKYSNCYGSSHSVHFTLKQSFLSAWNRDTKKGGSIRHTFTLSEIRYSACKQSEQFPYQCQVPAHQTGCMGKQRSQNREVPAPAGPPPQSSRPGPPKGDQIIIHNLLIIALASSSRLYVYILLVAEFVCSRSLAMLLTCWGHQNLGKNQCWPNS